MTRREDATNYLKGLQDRITQGIEEIDGKQFHEDSWSREGGGGGRTRVLENGNVFAGEAT